jgi:hypothetical protein
MRTLFILVLGLALGVGGTFAAVKYCPVVHNKVLGVKAGCNCDPCDCKDCKCENCKCPKCAGKVKAAVAVKCDGCKDCGCTECKCENCVCDKCPGKSKKAGKCCDHDHSK